jgi:hypothetical protein
VEPRWAEAPEPFTLEFRDGTVWPESPNLGKSSTASKKFRQAIVGVLTQAARKVPKPIAATFASSLFAAVCSSYEVFKARLSDLKRDGLLQDDGTDLWV